MAFFPDGTEYTEFIGKEGLGQSPIEHFAFPEPPDVRSRTKKIYETPWDTRGNALLQLLGTQTRGVNGGNPYISRTSPWAHQDWTVLMSQLAPGSVPTGNTSTTFYLYCNSVEMRGYGVDTVYVGRGSPDTMKNPGRDTAKYTTARCMVDFVAMPFVVLSDAQMVGAGYVDGNGNPDESTLTRYVTIYPKPKGQYLNLGGTGGIGGSGAFKYTNNPVNNLAGNGVIGAPGRILPSWDIQIRQWRVPHTCVGSILINPLLQNANQLGPLDTTPGKVNSTVFRLGKNASNGLPAGTLLYLPPEFVRYTDPYGVPMVDILHFFEFVPTGQNFVPAFVQVGGLQTIQFIEISTDGVSYAASNTITGKHVYDAVDFSPCFRAPI